MLEDMTTPNIVPANVPSKPIIDPVKTKILIITYFDAPIVLINAISDFLV